jgi:hypothetical protein
LWSQVDLLEPLSRNPDATELSGLETASTDCTSSAPSPFVPVHGLVTSAGEE